MADDDQTQAAGTTASTPAPAAPPATPTPTPASPQMVTLADAQEMANRAAAAARREEAAKRQPAPNAPTPQPQAATGSQGLSIEDVERIADRRAEFARMSERHKLSPEAEGIMKTLFRVENPENIGDWFATKAKAFGATAPIPPTTQTPTTPPTGGQTVTQAGASTQPAPAVAPGAPSTAVPLERPVSILDQSTEDIHERIRKKGGDPARPYAIKNRAVRREIRQETEGALATMRVQVPQK